MKSAILQCNQLVIVSCDIANTQRQGHGILKINVLNNIQIKTIVNNY